MRYAQLRAFHHVALNGGFSRAAAALNQTQPSLSDQVRKLEQAHDVRLFRRDGRQVRLTAQGEALLRLTRPFFEAEARIGEHLTASRAAIDGTLRIVADSAHHITGALAAFRQAHPRVFVRLHTGNTGEVLRALRDYDAEIGVIGGPDTAPDLEPVALGSTPITAIAARGFLPAPGESLSLADLADLPLIFRENGSRTRAALTRAARAAGLRLAPVLEVEGREAMREVVASGAGLGFVSRAEFGNDMRLVQVPLAGEGLDMPETAVSLRARRDVPVIRAFLRALRKTQTGRQAG